MDVVSRSLSLVIPLQDPVCFTDSKVTLNWIKGQNKEWKQFVQNRVCEIRKLLRIQCWRHCAGHDNAADIPSRGIDPQELKDHKLWYNGPRWLTDLDSDGGEEEEMTLPEDCLLEAKVKHLQEASTTTMLTSEEPRGLSQIMECGNYSSLSRLLMVTVLVLKFVKALRTPLESCCDAVSSLTCDGIMEAERLWILESRTSLIQHTKFKLWRAQFNLFRDKVGVWRCGGRLQRSTLPQPSIHPILLSAEHPFTSLIVKDCHDKVQHNGVKETLTQLRSQYWVIRGRSLVKKLLHGCVVCRKVDGKPFSSLPPPPLPEFRVKEQPPFKYTGVDFARSLYVRNGSFMSKVWVCLYTCCIIRAVHLDLVSNLSALTFIGSFRRFTAR